MDLQDSVDLGNGCVVEIGPIVEIARRDLLDVETTACLIDVLTTSLARRTPRTLSLEEVLDRVTDENRHAEIDTGAAVGNEAW